VLKPVLFELKSALFEPKFALFELKCASKVTSIRSGIHAAGPKTSPPRIDFLLKKRNMAAL
jgi:hypothetical protein